jgi:hypothetical protein
VTRDELVELVRLKQAAVDCQNAYEGWGLINLHGRTTEELVTIDLRYREAQQRFWEARRAYDEALNDFIRIEKAGDQVSRPDA